MGIEDGKRRISQHRILKNQTVSEIIQKSRVGSGLSQTVASNNTQSDEQRRKEINDYLRSIIFNEADIQKAIDNEDRRNRIEGDYLVVYKDVNIQSEKNGLEMLCSPSRGDIYPGMLIVVDNNLGTDSPSEALIPRGAVTINIPDFRGGNYERTIQPDANGNLQAKVNDAINAMIDEQAKLGILTAKFSDLTSQAESLDEMSMKLNCSASFKGLTASAGYDNKSSEYSMHFMTDYSQVFFEVKAQLGADLSKLFGPNVTKRDIQDIVQNKTLLFVSSVKYGRRFYALETISSSNQNLVQTAKISSSGFSVDEKYTSSQSRIRYDSRYLVEGGDIQNADVLFKQKSIEEAKSDLKSTDSTKEPTYIDIVRKQVEAMKAKVNEFKTNHTSVNLLTGQKETDMNGVILTYKAKSVTGANPKDVTFWQSGVHKVKRLIPNHGLRVNFFNSLKATDLMLTGYYTLCDKNGIELPTKYPLWNDSIERGIRIGNKESAPTAMINVANVLGVSERSNYAVYEVYIKVINCRTHLTFEHHYALPCCDISALWQRAGSRGGDNVNWFSIGRDDNWYND